MVEGYFDWNWEEAFRDFDRALDINPSLSIAYRQNYPVLRQNPIGPDFRFLLACGSIVSER